MLCLENILYVEFNKTKCSQVRFHDVSTVSVKKKGAKQPAANRKNLEVENRVRTGLQNCNTPTKHADSLSG